eukprot:3162320-Pyramimonas_sp.AAC.1
MLASSACTCCWMCCGTLVTGPCWSCSHSWARDGNGLTCGLGVAAATECTVIACCASNWAISSRAAAI